MSEDTGAASLPVAEFTFDAAGLAGPWHVRAFTLNEELGGSYLATVDLLHEDPEADLFALNGTSCTLTIWRGSVVTRKLHGIGQGAELDGWSNAGHLRARVQLVPALAVLGTGRDLRWFRDLTTPAILDQVLGAGLGRYGRAVDARLRRTGERTDGDLGYAVRETCAQYHESDRSFVARLCEDEGITMFHDHAGDAETLTLIDDNAGFPRLGRDAPVRLLLDSNQVHSAESVFAFRTRSKPAPARVIAQDQDLTRPLVAMRKETAVPNAAAGGGGAGNDRAQAAAPGTLEEDYVYPAGLTFTRKADGSGTYRGSDLDARARLQWEASQARNLMGIGAGDVTGFAPGTTFELDAGRPVWDRAYVLTKVTHFGVAPELFEGDEAEAPRDANGMLGDRLARAAGNLRHSEAGAIRGPGELRRYWNQFECVPLDVPFRPARKTSKPVGRLDRAVVVAPLGTGDDIHTDERGYVKVNFVGNREEREVTEPDDKRSAWIPVVQGWLGAGLGQRIIPRRGMEVLVAYQEGDPDRPVVLTCLPTSVNVLPYELPQDKTRSVFFRTASSPNGPPNYSELSVDDARGREQVFLRAARDLDKLVLHDQRAEIRRDEQRAVRRNQSLHVVGVRTRRVDQDEIVAVHGGRSLQVDHDQLTTIGANEARLVAVDRTTSVGGNERLAVEGDRSGDVTGNDVLHVARDRAVTVDETLTMRQGPTTMTWAEGHVELVTGAWLRIKHGPAEILVDDDGNVRISTSEDVQVSAKNIKLTGERIAIEGSQEVSLSGGGGAMKLDPTGAAISGQKLTSSAQATNEITGAIVKIN